MLSLSALVRLEEKWRRKGGAIKLLVPSSHGEFEEGHDDRCRIVSCVFTRTNKSVFQIALCRYIFVVLAERTNAGCDIVEKVVL